ncbi:hypothetical protein LCGC14_2566230 [marine sediment metagenome]|uniref:Uncharacterized protein n=1 Tax=marine sediment metagenome TaxID=412755 RepID=A0A0F9B6I5_9ZZZZ
MKNIKMFGKIVPLIAVLLVGMLTIVASAELQDFYGTVTSTVTISQAVKLDGGTDDIVDEIPIAAFDGDIVYGPDYQLENFANRWILVDLIVITADEDYVAYPEYKLVPDTVGLPGDEDDVHFYIGSSLTWSEFISASFDFNIESGHERAPHVNLWLRKGDLELQLTTWAGGLPPVSISGNTATYDHDDFTVTHTTDLGTDWENGLSEDWIVREVRIQSGDPSKDPNEDSSLLWEQVVYVSNVKVNTILTPMVELPTQDFANSPGRMVEFRIAYAFEAGIIPTSYVTTIGVKPMATVGRSGVTSGGVVIP